MGARVYLGRDFNRCTGISSLRLIRGRGVFGRFFFFPFFFAVHFLNGKFVQSTRINLVICAVCSTFVIAAFMAEVAVFLHLE